MHTHTCSHTVFLNNNNNNAYAWNSRRLKMWFKKIHIFYKSNKVRTITISVVINIGGVVYPEVSKSLLNMQSQTKTITNR